MASSVEETLSSTARRRWEEEMIKHVDLVDCLSRSFPERRCEILARANELDRDLCSVVSALFWWGILEPCRRRLKTDPVSTVEF